MQDFFTVKTNKFSVQVMSMSKVIAESEYFNSSCLYHSVQHPKTKRDIKQGYVYNAFMILDCNIVH